MEDGPGERGRMRREGPGCSGESTVLVCLPRQSNNSLEQSEVKWRQASLSRDAGIDPMLRRDLT